MVRWRYHSTYFRSQFDGEEGRRHQGIVRKYGNNWPWRGQQRWSRDHDLSSCSWFETVITISVPAYDSSPVLLIQVRDHDLSPYSFEPMITIPTRANDSNLCSWFKPIVEIWVCAHDSNPCSQFESVLTIQVCSHLYISLLWCFIGHPLL